MPDDRSPVQHTIALRRLDPDTNVARFYVLTLERDLFDNVVVTRQWGGWPPPVASSQSRSRAAEAMGRLAAAKRRRGYRDL